MISKLIDIPYDDIDKEIVELCRALNSIDGVETVESCCGHGERECHIWLTIRDIQTLNKLCFHCFNREYFWELITDVADPHRDWKMLHFLLKSKTICYQGDFDELAERLNKRKDDIKLSDEEWRNLR